MQVYSHAMLPKSERRSPCPVACTLDVLGDRWTLLVIRDLMLGKRYFDEFRDSPEGIATNILSARLARLCEFKLARRLEDQQDKRRVGYELTPAGWALKPLLLEAVKWGMQHIRGTRLMSGSERAIRGAAAAAKSASSRA
jgi:DNA-binding HxlR family transcriptional regulator